MVEREDRAASTANAVRDDEPAQADADRSESRAKVRKTVPLLMSVAVVLAVAAACVFGILWWQERSEDQLRASAEESATRMITDLATYSHDDFDANITTVKESATEEFSESYSEVAESLRELVVNGEGESTAEVSHAAVESISDEQAVVLVFLDQNIVNVAAPDGRQDVSRMVVTLDRHNGEWKLQDAQTV